MLCRSVSRVGDKPVQLEAGDCLVDILEEPGSKHDLGSF